MAPIQPPAGAADDRPHRRGLRFFAVISVVALTAVIACRAVACHLSINVTQSLPPGLYWLSPTRQPARGSLVAFPPPASVRELVTARRYLPPSVLLLKRVVAVAGDVVCIAGNRYSANGIPLDVIAAADHAGRPLPRPFPFCGVVPPGVVFVAGHGPSSLDSRYFGPVPLSTLTVAVPLWTSS
jgi:conjugative transfer signal peptidase TraF